MSIGVIAPDKPSGTAFVDEFARAGVQTVVYYPTIAPRVIGESISRDPRVAHDLQRAIDHATQEGAGTLAIACNTLQLWLPQIRSSVPVVTTFEVIKTAFPGRGTRPIWLGTTALVSAMGADFDTLLTLDKGDLQHLVQEIIWRVKAVTGADYSTAFAIEKPENQEVLLEKVAELERQLLLLGITRAILGCTELPIAFRDYYAAAGVGDETKLELIDPAYFMARALKEVD